MPVSTMIFRASAAVSIAALMAALPLSPSMTAGGKMLLGAAHAQIMPPGPTPGPGPGPTPGPGPGPTPGPGPGPTPGPGPGPTPTPGPTTTPTTGGGLTQTSQGWGPASIAVPEKNSSVDEEVVQNESASDEGQDNSGSIYTTTVVETTNTVRTTYTTTHNPDESVTVTEQKVPSAETPSAPTETIRVSTDTGTTSFKVSPAAAETVKSALDDNTATPVIKTVLQLASTTPANPDLSNSRNALTDLIAEIKKHASVQVDSQRVSTVGLALDTAQPQVLDLSPTPVVQTTSGFGTPAPTLQIQNGGMQLPLVATSIIE